MGRKRARIRYSFCGAGVDVALDCDARPPTRAKQTAYVLVTALLPYLHIYGTLVILTQNAWYALLLCFRRRELKVRAGQWIILQLVMFVLLLPFLKIFFHNVHQVSQGFWIPRPTLWVLFQNPVRIHGLAIPDPR